MSKRDLKHQLFRIVASSAISLVMGIIGREISKAMRRSRTAKKVDRKLDMALEQTMDCSDPVAQY